MNRCFAFYCLLLFFLTSIVVAQVTKNSKPYNFTRQDTLRGSITKERVWWDVKNYHLAIKVNPSDSSITGTNRLKYHVIKEYNCIQIDLQNPMQILKVVQDDKELNFIRDGNAFFIDLKSPQNIGDTKELLIYFSGKPKVAVNSPWDGGISWKKDSNGNSFIASSCQGIGASVWWPNKDQMQDEVDNMLISVNVPSNLINVSNGRLQSVKKLKDGTTTYNWYVSNPINNYGININIGNYVSFSEKFKGEKGILDCNYYVLKDNLAKAKVHFKEVKRMLKAFEYWFGPYPFYEDSYKIVETPFLGMEHQSAISYGNGFKNGYLGNDLSGTGWGKKFDFIIVHESGHEWFGNSITYADSADKWISESFADYSESLFLEYYFGKKAAEEYVIGLRKNVLNDKPIIGFYNVNNEGSSDMYYKGSNMLHTLRQVLNDDVKWRAILRGLNTNFYHKIVTTKQIENYLIQNICIDLKPFFNQYLRDTRIPTFEYYLKENQLIYRWTNCVENFNLPLKIYINGTEKWIYPVLNWDKLNLDVANSVITIDKNFYITTTQILE